MKDGGILTERETNLGGEKTAYSLMIPSENPGMASRRFLLIFFVAVRDGSEGGSSLV